MFERAANWVAALLTGSIAVSIAVLAVAVIGFLLLQGRLPYMLAARVVLGCFVLFGAAGFGAALVDLGGGAAVPPAPAAEAPRYAPVAPVAVSSDPYAGATVPDLRGINVPD